MAKTSIEWCDYTFNPWNGCTKVAPGCEHCYAEAIAKRFKYARWGPQGTRVLASDAYWDKPRKWNARAGTCPQCRAKPPRVQMVGSDCVCSACGITGRQLNRPRVFCASMADIFEDWPGPLVSPTDEKLYGPDGEDFLRLVDARKRLFDLIDATPHLDWLLLTKRPENIREMWRAVTDGSMPTGFRRDNVWLLTSVAVQEDADSNIPELLKCRDLAPVLGVSCEPLLGLVNLKAWMPWAGHPDDYRPTRHNAFGIDWVIAGGESGPHAQPMHPDWPRSLRDQCAGAGVPFLFKQWGEWAPWDGRHDPDLPSRMKKLPNLGSKMMPDGSYPKGNVTREQMDKIQRHGVHMVLAGKKVAGRLLDRELHNAFPDAWQAENAQERTAT